MPFSIPEQPQRPTEPCAVCGEQTSVGCEVDRNDGRDFVRYPVCDVGCYQDLIDRMTSSGAGAQLRSYYPARGDV